MHTNHDDIHYGYDIRNELNVRWSLPTMTSIKWSQFYILVRSYKANEIFLVETIRLCGRSFCWRTGSFFGKQISL